MSNTWQGSWSYGGLVDSAIYEYYTKVAAASDLENLRYLGRVMIVLDAPCRGSHHLCPAGQTTHSRPSVPRSKIICDHCTMQAADLIISVGIDSLLLPELRATTHELLSILILAVLKDPSFTLDSLDEGVSCF